MAEIMAPAGGPEQLEASVRSGADRVYFGCGALNARRNAHGFESPEWVIEYCHARGVKATAALNILLHDTELDEAAHMIRRIGAAGADGMIVQDLAVARMAKEICPELPLHASTQMTIHSLDGVKAMESLGFSRVVLARELSLREIAAIRDATDLELEVFVHGALCMCMSGGCYLSSMLGGRSGNRGLCAQPCRLDFDRGDRRFALSLKDMSYLPHIKELVALGIDSFKIEGRMKRPEYAAAVVDQLSRAMRGETPDMPLLQSVFSRSGFTDGYYTGKRDAHMFGSRTKEDTKLTAAVLPGLSELFRRERQRVPVDMKFFVSEDSPCKLQVRTGEQEVTVTGGIPQKAVNRPLTEEFARNCFAKCGGTPYTMQSFSAEIPDGLMLPMSDLNALRRSALEQLTEHRIKSAGYPVFPYTPPAFSRREFSGFSLRAAAQTYEQVRRLTGLSYLYLPADEILKNPECISVWKDRLIALLPALNFNSIALHDLLDRLHTAGVKRVAVQNIGELGPSVDRGFTVHGGHGLNILNSLSLSEYFALGLADAVLSFELSKGPMAALNGTGQYGALIYGHLPLMQTRACPLKRTNGCETCPGEGKLTDRKGEGFRLACHGRQYTTVYNPIPLYLADRELPVDFGVLYFTNESPARCEAITQMALSGEKPDFPHTRGLLDRSLL